MPRKPPPKQMPAPPPQEKAHKGPPQLTYPEENRALPAPPPS